MSRVEECLGHRHASPWASATWGDPQRPNLGCLEAFDVFFIIFLGFLNLLWEKTGGFLFSEKARAEASGGLKGITASGAELPEPENGGKLLHQRWFRPFFFFRQVGEVR